MKDELPALIFVYNGDTGALNWLADVLQKTLRPSSYKCKLCAITHSAVRMHPEWREFLDALPIRWTQLHRSDLKDRFGSIDVELPSVLLQLPTGRVEEWISADELNQLATLVDLMSLVKSRLSALASAE